MSNLTLLAAFARRMVSDRQRARGFTLVELIAAVLMSSLVISALLALLNDLAVDERRERVRAETERDMKRTLDFMAAELRDAVFVYTGAQLGDPAAAGSVANALNAAADSDREPILVFWKAELIPYTEGGAGVPADCSALPAATDVTEADCQALQIEQQTYTLVAYFHDKSPTGSSVAGESVIRRYELRKYDVDETFVETSGRTVLSLAREPNYVDPRKEGSFERWPNRADGTAPVGSTGAAIAPLPPTGTTINTFVLTDFVDNGSAGGSPSCPGVHLPSPRPAVIDSHRSFYACVRQVAAGRGNQDVIIYLRGNANGRDNYQESGDLPLPMVQTQVLLRGAIDKDFDD